MCDSCGCNLTSGSRHPAGAGAGSGGAPEGTKSVEVLKGLLEANDRQARHNREHLARHGVLAVNLMSSPGAGKTALLEATIEALSGRFRIAVIEGDLETENDAARIRRKGVPAVQITTGTACHLDANMVHEALHALSLEALDILFIENVGNLVCPASFDLGQHHNVALLSAPEGDDKPAKYPVMFRAADLVVLTKADLLTLLGDFDPAAAEASVRRLGSCVPVFSLSARTSAGMAAWCDWLGARRREVARALRPRPTASAPTTLTT